MEKVFVSVFGKTKKELLAMIEISRDFTNNFELRFDLCGDWKFTEKNLRDLFPPNARVIFTDRENNPPPDKGELEGVLNFGKNFELIDYDLKNLSPDLAYDKLLSKSGLDFLISAHLFDKFSREKTASTIKQIQDELPLLAGESGSEVVTNLPKYKLAVNLDTWQDLEDFINLSKNLDQEKWILAGMGEFGKISRGILAKNGFYTFASVKNHEVAPGQIDLETLKTLLS